MVDQPKIAGLQQATDSLCQGVYYRMDPRYGYLPASFDMHNVQWGSIEEACRAKPPTTGSVFLLGQLKNIGNTADRLHYIQSHVAAATGFRSFSFLNQGTGTLVLLGKSDTNLGVLRISPAPDVRCNAIKDDCVRSTFPGLLQGMDDPVNIDGALRVEVLPFVETKSVGEVPGGAALYRFFSEIAEGTCFAPCASEVAILPDKTILILDPGECPYTEDYWEQNMAERQVDEEESFLLVERRLANRVSYLPASLRWLSAGQTLKQDLIYMSPSSGRQDAGVDAASLVYNGP